MEMPHQDPVTGTGSVLASLPRATAEDYLALARPDHWVKHVFIVPGIVLACLLHPTDLASLVHPILFGLLSAAAIASANYVLNEWLDRSHDAFHPTKSLRPAVRRQLSPVWVSVEYAALTAVGLAVAAGLSRLYLLTSAAFLASGVLYNVRPWRTKERVFLGVMSETLNNPIRLPLGWAVVDPGTLPPSSLLLAYRMGGAFLIAVERFAECRDRPPRSRFVQRAISSLQSRRRNSSTGSTRTSSQSALRSPR